MISLQELLLSRDVRAAHQRELLDANPGKTLVCLTVQLPGTEKRSAASLAIAAAAVDAIDSQLEPVYRELKDLETGFEGYFLVEKPALDVKRYACRIEDTHPLGRLMDIDVVGTSREDIGLEPRRCLLCNNEVRYCMRAKTHTTGELLEKIHQMLTDYQNNC